MAQVPFEGINFGAEEICKHKSAKDFIEAAKHQYFVGREDQESIMTAVYNLCREATGNPVKVRKTAPIEPEGESPATTEGEGGE